MEVDHNVSPGPLCRCQVCGSSDLELVIDVGHQPLCDSLLTSEQLNEPETYYPLRLLRCPSCTVAQLDYVVDGSTVYHQNYPYRTGVTKELAQYQIAMAEDLTQRYGLQPRSFVVDIGSNDGTLLAGFKQRGARVLGVEPTNIAQVAEAAGIDTVHSFFNLSVAQEIVATHGKADLITASNVFAHMASLGDVVEGVRALLKDDGVFVVENHYLVDVLNKAQYDTIYHEHLRTYSCKSLVTLFSFYGMIIFHAERVSRYGGNIRAHICKDARPAQASVDFLIRAEHEIGLARPEIYEEFRRKVELSRDCLLRFGVRCRERRIALCWQLLSRTRKHFASLLRHGDAADAIHRRTASFS